VKPNDHRGLELMDHAAVDLMREFPDIIIGFGQSDEFRYVYLIPMPANLAIVIIFRQFSPSQIHDTVQQTPIKNYVDSVLLFHSFVHDELENILSRHLSSSHHPFV
jgi:hypothetical protein